MKKPVVCISIANNINEFELRCSELFDAGYKMKSSNVGFCSNGGQYDEFWEAIFVLPEFLQ